MEAKPIQSYTFGLTLDNPIDFVFSSHLSWRLAPQSGEHHQNSNVFLVCKNENKSKKNYR